MIPENSLARTANKNILIENVWQNISAELSNEVVTFWEDHDMLRPGFSADERAREVVLILRSAKDKKIVGLSTAAEVVFKQLNDNKFYLYRSIILPEFRHPGLTSKVIVVTRDLLEKHSAENGNGYAGMLTFVENPRIQQFRREAIWPASKMAFIGIDKQGRHIRVYYFKGIQI